MSINHARRFVVQLKEDNNFRERTLKTTGPEDLSSFLQTEGLIFDNRELVGAMAECMEQLEQEEGG